MRLKHYVQLFDKPFYFLKGTLEALPSAFIHYVYLYRAFLLSTFLLSTFFLSAFFLMSPITFANSFNQFYAQLSVEELELAQKVLQKSIETEPNDQKFKQDLAFIQYYSGDLEASLESFTSLATNANVQDNANVFYGLALVQHELEQAPASLKSIVTAYSLAPDNYEIVKLYADISHQMNLHQETIKTHDKEQNVSVLIPESPAEDSQFNFKSALDNYKSNNIAAARKQLESLLEDNPDDIDAMVLLAFILYREGNSIEAEQIFSDLASRENFDENSDVLYGLALSQRNLGKNVEAFENILRAIVAETTREDLKALYRSLALSLTTETPKAAIPPAAEESSSSITLTDVIADVTKSEDFNKNP